MPKQKEIAIAAKVVDTEYSDGKPHVVIRFETQEDFRKAMSGVSITISYKEN